jgi:hypothetical protein
MKRFHLFAGDTYYPGGGLKDYRGSYESERAAIVDGLNGKYVGESFDWWEVVEALEDGSLIESTEGSNGLYQGESRGI